MKIVFNAPTKGVSADIEIERGQMIAMGKRLFDMGRDLKLDVIVMDITPDSLELRGLRAFNGHAPAADMFDATKLGTIAK